jgi:ParB-like chromosome segregation protein Spo0J
MAGGQAIEGAKRGVLFHVDPLDVCLPGIDYKCGQEDPSYNPRNFDPVDLGLVDSIMRLGVLQPIGVIKRDHFGKPIVQYGNQRVRAAREANERLRAAGKPLILVPCQSPLRGFDDAELSEAAIAENEHRRESSPLAKCELAAQHLKRRGGDFKEAAKAFNMSESGFRSLIKLKEAAPSVKKAIEKGKIGTSAAIEIAGLPIEEQEARLEQVVAAGGTVAQAVKVVREAKGTSKTARPGTALLKAIWKRRKSAAVIGKFDSNFGEGFLDCLGWVLGELQADDVDGLAEAIDALEAGE